MKLGIFILVCIGLIGYVVHDRVDMILKITGEQQVKLEKALTAWEAKQAEVDGMLKYDPEQKRIDKEQRDSFSSVIKQYNKQSAVYHDWMKQYLKREKDYKARVRELKKEVVDLKKEVEAHEKRIKKDKKKKGGYSDIEYSY